MGLGKWVETTEQRWAEGISEGEHSFQSEGKAWTKKQPEMVLVSSCCVERRSRQVDREAYEEVG